MSNSHGRQRTGFPPPRPAQGDDRAQDPYRQPDEPSLSWPPRAPQQQPSHQSTDWGYDQPGAGQPVQTGYQNEPEWHQPQQGYPPAQTAYPPQDDYREPTAPPAGNQSRPQQRYSDDPFAPPPQPRDNRGYGGQTGPDPHASRYAAQFEAYVPPSVAPEPTTGRPQSGGGYGAPRTEPALRGSSHEDDWTTTQPPQGAYARGDTGYYQQPDYSSEQSYSPEPQTYGSEQWGEPQQGAADTGYPGTAYAADPYAYPSDPYAQQIDPSLSSGPQNVAVNDEYVEYDGEYEEDEAAPSNGKRLLTVVGALVGAIVVGAGLAYGYKAFVGGETKISSAPPVVRGDAAATKARPDSPGGRSFDHTDSKVMRRISEGGRASTSADGTRRVPTMMIGRDGNVVDTGAASMPSAAPPEEPAVSVPGLTVVDGFAGQRAARRVAAEQQQAAGGGPIVVEPPKTSAAALSPVRPVTVSEPPRAIEPPARAPEKVIAAATPPKTSDPVAKTQPKPRVAAKTAPSSGGKGYVAVLASVPVSATSRLDALKTFADIQQNYGTVLQNRTPDVREANLGSKGTYHRLMVGPPSSREAANALCKELKSAGYSSCWITAY